MQGNRYPELFACLKNTRTASAIKSFERIGRNVSLDIDCLDAMASCPGYCILDRKPSTYVDANAVDESHPSLPVPCAATCASCATRLDCCTFLYTSGRA